MSRTLTTRSHLPAQVRLAEVAAQPLDLARASVAATFDVVKTILCLQKATSCWRVSPRDRMAPCNNDGADPLGQPVLEKLQF
jgi:hypothetical protein